MGASTSDHLTSHDLEMIDISWKFVDKKHDLGLNTMIRIFETSNELKNIFRLNSSLDLVDERIENTSLPYHAAQVIKTLDKIIFLSTCSIIREHDKAELVELGERHFYYGLKKEHFLIFENCFIKCLEESLQVNIFQSKFEHPWRKLMQYIFKKYTNGLNCEKKRYAQYKVDLFQADHANNLK